MGLQKPNADDIMNYADDTNAAIAKLNETRKDLHQKYIAQSPYKVGDKFLIKHRKHGILKAVLKKIRVNELTGEYEYTFSVDGWKLTSAHILSMTRR
jgi:hypothetical protein